MKLVTYQDYVREGKKIVHAREVYQATLAWMALQVVTIKHGGRGYTHYTLTEYARDIGVHRKTLNEWTHVYRNVIQRLDLDPSKVTSDQWRIATRVSNLLRDEKRQIQEASGQKRRKGRGWNFNVLIPQERIRDLFNAEMNGRSAQAEINGFCDSIIHIKNKLRRMELSTVSDVSLRSLKKNLDEASSEIINYLLNHKGVSMAQLQEGYTC
jgi:DNA-binding XRE family transcriptional regulator